MIAQALVIAVLVLCVTYLLLLTHSQEKRLKEIERKGNGDKK